ncbi:hypothetical protein IL306_006744 [Fusarium sp. DS 682]|nr:hypothetical protein IL306_006744 [Fusarium sp. DS 682]
MSPPSLSSLPEELMDFHDGDLTSLPAFQAVINSETLKDLRLNIAGDIKDRPLDIYVPSHQSLYHNLPYTWLTPKVASNLQVLSLFGHNPWGWLPKMDLRLISVDGLPNLKVKDSQGQIHKFSNKGYYVQGVLNGFPMHDDKPIETGFCWHHLFNHWANSMPNLRVFKLGQGHWSGKDAWKAIDPTYEGDFYEWVEEDHEAIFQPFADTDHLYFECPAPLTSETGIRRYGSKAVQDYGAVFPYVEYAKPRIYDYTEEFGGRDRVDVDKEDEKKDKNAFEKFLSVVETRRNWLAVKE